MSDSPESSLNNETAEVPLPQDKTLSGEKRTQGLGDQVFMLVVGAGLVAAGVTRYLSLPPEVPVALGAFAMGTAFERAQWMVMSEYGSWRGLVRSALGKEVDA